MKFIQGQNREQIYLFPVSLNDAVDPENEVRLIDVFVSSLKQYLEGIAQLFCNNIARLKPFLSYITIFK